MTREEHLAHRRDDNLIRRIQSFFTKNLYRTVKWRSLEAKNENLMEKNGCTELFYYIIKFVVDSFRNNYQSRYCSRVNTYIHTFMYTKIESVN